MQAGAVNIKLMADIIDLQNKMQQAEKLVSGAVGRIKSDFGGMLAGLGAGISVAGLVAFVKSAINAADALDEMSGRVGVSAKELSGLQLAFRQAGMTNDDMGTSLAKMSRQMADGNKVFDAMGVRVKNTDGTLRGTTSVLSDVADQFAGMQDGAGKTALAMELFGKSGASMVPLLNSGSEGIREMTDMAEKLGLVIEDSAAAQAGQFNDSLELLQLGVSGVGQRIAAQLLPTLNGLAGEFLTTMTSGDKLKNTADFLSNALKVLYIGGIGTIEVFSSVGKVVGGTAAAIMAALKGNFSEATNIMSTLADDVETGWTDAAGRMKAAWETQGNAAVEAAAKGIGANKNLIDEQKKREDSEKSGATAAAAALKAQESFVKGLEKESDKLRLTTTEAKLKEAALLGITGKTLAHVQALLEQDEAYKKSVKSAQDRADLRKKEFDEIQAYMRAQSEAYAADAKASQDALAAAQAEYDQYGLTKSQIAEITLTRLQDQLVNKTAGSEAYESLQKQIEAQRELIQLMRKGEARDASAQSAKTAADEWKKASDKIENTLTDALMRGFESGKDFAKNMRDTVVNMFKTMVLRPVISAVMNPIAQGITGSLGLSGAANAGTSMMGQASNAYSAFGTVAGGASAFGSAFSAGAAVGTEAFGAGMTMMAEASGMSSFMAGAGQALGALGPAGWAALAVGALLASGAFTGETRSGATYSTGADGNVQFAQGPSGGEIAGSQARMLFNATQATITNTLKAVGSTATLTGFTAGLESSDNGKGFQFAGGYVGGNAFGENLGRSGGQFGMQSQDQKTAFANYGTQLSQSIIEALQVTADIPATVAKLISDGLNGGSVKDLTTEASSALLTSINTLVGNVSTLRDALNTLPFESLKNLSFDAAAGLIAAAGGLESLGANLKGYYDNFYSAEEKKAQLTANTTKAFEELGLVMPKLDASLKSAYRAEVERLAGIVKANDLAGKSVESDAKAYAGALALQGAVAELGDQFLAGASATDKFTALYISELGRAPDVGGLGYWVNQVEMGFQTIEQATKKFSEGAKTEQLKLKLLEATNPAKYTLELRRRELSTMTPVNQALQQQIYFLQDTKAAQDEYNAALGNAKSAADSARQAVAAAESAVLAVQSAGTDAYLAAKEKEAQATQRVADLHLQAAQKLQNTGRSLREFVSSEISASADPITGNALAQSEFSRLLGLANSGDTAAYDLLGTAGKNLLDASREIMSTQDFESVRRSVLRTLNDAASAAEAAALKENTKANDLMGLDAQPDAMTAALESLTLAQADTAEALRIANAINAPLERTQRDLIAEYASASDTLAEAVSALTKAQQALEAIVLNTAEIVTAVDALATALDTAAIGTAATVEFIVTSDLPAYLKDLAQDGTLSVQATIDFLRGPGSTLPQGMQDLIAGTLNTFNATTNFLVGADLPAELKELALRASGQITSTTFDFVSGVYSLTPDETKLALKASDTLSRTVNLLAGSVLDADTKAIALGTASTYTTVVNAALSSAIGAPIRNLILNGAGDYAATVKAVASSDLSAELKKVMFDGVGDYTTNLKAVLDSSIPDAQKILLLNSSSSALRSINLAASFGTALTAAETQALLMASQAVSKSVALAVSGGSITADQAVLLNTTSSTATKTLNEVVNGGVLTTDQKTILGSTDSTVTKVLNEVANGGTLTVAQADFLKIVSGEVTRTVNEIMNQALNMSATGGTLTAAQADFLKILDGTVTRTLNEVATGGTLTGAQADFLKILDGTITRTLNEIATGGTLTTAQSDFLKVLDGTITRTLNAVATGGTLTANQEAILKLANGGGTATVTLGGSVAMSADITLGNIFKAIAVSGALTVDWLISVHNAILNSAGMPGSAPNLAAGDTSKAAAMALAASGYANYTASALGNVFSGGAVQAFANGGAFTNSVVSSATLAPMALFGEAGPEAIMPLSRGSDGSLGVTANLPSMRMQGNGNAGIEARLDAVVSELAATRKDNAALRARMDQMLVEATRTAQSVGDIRRNGVQVYTDASEPLDTVAA